MNKKFISKIIVLTSLFAISGCSSTPQPVAAQDAIMTAEELQSKIQVTVTQTVAARD